MTKYDYQLSNMLYEIEPGGELLKKAMPPGREGKAKKEGGTPPQAQVRPDGTTTLGASPAAHPTSLPRCFNQCFV